MKKLLLAAALLTGAASGMALTPDAGEHYRVWRPFNETVFYDGYNGTVFDADKTEEDGIVRHTNYLYARRLTEQDFAWFGRETDLNITIGALCDNYDRIGNVSISLLPKGSDYAPSADMRFELVRFITPFMDKNTQPYEVPYHYDARLLTMIMRDKALQEKYDMWLELELFGIPYAANAQITGCADRNDVFRGTVEFVAHDDPAPAVDDHVLVPIWHKIPELHGNKNLNSYDPVACDEVGICSRTWTFEVPCHLSDATLTLNTSNHGAASGGEEYNRRVHFVYVDEELTLTFTPGGTSCEPYRFYNTQANGIYGNYKQSDNNWARRSNWCPGQAVPVRVLHLGELSEGKHTVRIAVPDAEFKGNNGGKDGDVRVSMYLQGVREGQLPAQIEDVEAEGVAGHFSYDGRVVTLQGIPVSEVAIYSAEGQLLWGAMTDKGEASLVGMPGGLYLVTFTTPEGEILTYKALR